MNRIAISLAALLLQHSGYNAGDDFYVMGENYKTRKLGTFTCSFCFLAKLLLEVTLDNGMQNVKALVCSS